MDLYEIMFIQNPDLGEEDREKLFTRFRNTVSKNGGEIINTQDQGIKTLAFKIQKRSRGRYFLIHLEGPGSMISELERFMRLDENIMRFVTIKLDKHVTREDLITKAITEAEPAVEAEQAPEEAPAAEAEEEAETAEEEEVE
ncbi:MAG: 30S ribosomal protein S6 [Desulfomonilia bacterium]|jgi:small subunit ribosomal protein S6|uniref:30S ribosomal protein S6 n=1 Tax=anaerobic digester metagenome TaxID=1263854 RepID=A0A485LZT8_9ZZZZ|nr:30S ribosomal protein S6 [Pseudomonadota bacterium]HON38395.1 30S ribosomal protein S6 [Deltaproteobacteria bacterium]HRS56432.1 30S ribosomal protein S6 [Desulfomonilia bacterium]HPD21586.1 30S ribosomal protein S6 [Deltaproteobacteria bacterium]HPX17244.1 30S ribosomal protein S6 [Deltaproteobacteria bacterium]